MRAPIQYGIVQTGVPVEGGVPCVRVMDLSTEPIHTDSIVRVDPGIHARYRKTCLEEKDLLFVLRGDIGVVREVTPGLVGANIHRGVARLSPNLDLVDHRYVLHALQAPAASKEMHERATGSALKELPINQLRRLPIPVPPIAIQRSIASLLDLLTERITLARVALNARRRRMRALMDALLTGRRRFVASDAGPWIDIPIGELFDATARPIEWDEGASYDLLSIRRRSGGVFLRSRMRAMDISTKTLFEAHEGDILISKMQAVHGAVGIAKAEHHGMKISGSYVALRPRAGAPIVPAFFAWLTRLPLMYRAVLLSSYGVHIEKMTFNLAWYFRTVVSLPGVAEQRRIVELLDLCERDERSLEQLVVALDRQKRGFLAKLLSGEIQVPSI